MKSSDYAPQSFDLSLLDSFITCNKSTFESAQKFAESLGRETEVGLLFQEKVWTRALEKAHDPFFSGWVKFYSESLMKAKLDSKFVKEGYQKISKAAWEKDAAGNLSAFKLISALRYADSLGRHTEEGLVFQEKVWTRCVKECDATVVRFWGANYCESLQHAGKSTKSVWDVVLEKEQKEIKEGKVALENGRKALRKDREAILENDRKEVLEKYRKEVLEKYRRSWRNIRRRPWRMIGKRSWRKKRGLGEL